MEHLYAVPTGQDEEEDYYIEDDRRRVAGPLAELETALEGEPEPENNRKISEVAEEAIERGRVTSSNVSYVRLAAKEFEALLPNVPFEGVTQTHLYRYAESLHEDQSAKNTISGRLTKLSILFNYGIQRGYVSSNPRNGMNLSGLGVEQKSYISFTKQELHKIFEQEIPHRERLLMSILLITGMRKDEAALLTWEQVKEEDGIPFFDLTEAQVKTQGSKRKVPIVPYIQDLMGERETGRIFDYKLNKQGKTVNSSQACLRYIRAVTEHPQKSVHSLRGTLKDLLRDAGVPKDVNDFLTGHGQGDVASRYGSGPSLPVRLNALTSVEHPWLPPVTKR